MSAGTEDGSLLSTRCLIALVPKLRQMGLKKFVRDDCLLFLLSLNLLFTRVKFIQIHKLQMEK